MPETLEQVAESANGRVFVGDRRLGQDATVRFPAEIMDRLSGTVDSACAVEIAADVEQGQFHARDLGEPRFRLESVEPLGVIRASESLRGMKQELDSLPADLDGRELSRCNHLEDHGGLMR